MDMPDKSEHLAVSFFNWASKLTSTAIAFTAPEALPSISSL